MKSAPCFEVFVPILPTPKSYRSFGRRTVLSDKCREYQIEVCKFLEKHADKKLDGPLWAEYTFYMKRPDSRKNARFPDKKPDHDNLVKSLQDCLERAGVIENDSRIVMCATLKVYCSGENSSGICQPGTLVRLGKL